VNLKIINDNLSISSYSIDDIKKIKYNKSIDYISSQSKEDNSIKIISRYLNNQTSILFDNTNKALHNRLKNIDNSIFDSHDFSMLFFTSGSTGTPIGALKTKENLEKEIKAFSKLIKEYKIDKVVVTVPFIHIYGTLIGLLYPLLNNIDIVLKEHFLPYNLVDEIKANTLVVTTPLYINALNRVNIDKKLTDALFVSSTAPLSLDSIETFLDKYECNIIQLYGSTETGGIAYRANKENLWTPLDGVDISTNQNNELIVKSDYISKRLYTNEFIDTAGEIETFDYINIDNNNRFELIGRSSKILKVAGKRYSTIQIESILESYDDITHALVFVSDIKELRGDSLDITIESKKEFSKKEIKSIIKKEISNLKFDINLTIVDKIKTNQVGKKIR
jgi:acyl-coenzyme A synthetase/AMP-(fatty) acid ligase